ncbi:hypothetical protein STEG23_027850, partial [Scotinomys teguina]
RLGNHKALFEGYKLETRRQGSGSKFHLSHRSSLNANATGSKTKLGEHNYMISDPIPHGFFQEGFCPGTEMFPIIPSTELKVQSRKKDLWQGEDGVGSRMIGRKSLKPSKFYRYEF